MGGKRGHWRLLRESEVLLLGETVMIPDFVLVNEADETRKILIELVGFWHPNYLRRKVEKEHNANYAHLLLLVYQGLNVTEEAFEGSASEVIFFQNRPSSKRSCRQLRRWQSAFTARDPNGKGGNRQKVSRF
jgi:uncharacterized protein